MVPRIYEQFVIGGFTKGIIVDLSPHTTSNNLLFYRVFKRFLLMRVFNAVDISPDFIFLKGGAMMAESLSISILLKTVQL